MALYLGFIVRVVLLPTCLIIGVLSRRLLYPAVVFSQLTVPLVVDMLRHYVFRAMNAVAFVAEASLVLYLSGAGTILAWVLWVILAQAEWSKKQKSDMHNGSVAIHTALARHFLRMSGCVHHLVYQYSSPYRACSRESSLDNRQPGEIRSQDLAEATSSILADIEQTALIFLIGANLVVLYLASSYAGASGGTLDFVSMFLYLDIAILFVSLFKKLPDIVKTGKPFIHRIASVLTSNTTRAAAALVCMPIIFVHLVLMLLLDQASCRARKRRRCRKRQQRKTRQRTRRRGFTIADRQDGRYVEIWKRTKALTFTGRTCFGRSSRSELFMTLFVLVGQFTCYSFRPQCRHRGRRA